MVCAQVEPKGQPSLQAELGATFRVVALSGATFQNADLAETSIADANLEGTRINGVLVSDLFRAYNQLNKPT